MIDFSLRGRIVTAGLVLAATFILARGAFAQDQAGTVYAMTNGGGGNSILIFDRAANGALTSVGMSGQTDSTVPSNVEFLPKPFGPAVLQDRMRKLL